MLEESKLWARVVELLMHVKSDKAEIRTAAWNEMGKLSEKVIPLSDLSSSEDKPVAKAAKGLLEAIAHRAARPSAKEEAKEVSEKLLEVASSGRPVPVRAWALHLLGFTADGRAVPGIARLLKVTEVQEEARLALERIPGSASTGALKGASETTSAPFRPNIEQSLRAREATPKTVGTTLVKR